MLKSDFEKIMTIMKDFYKWLDPDKVIEAAVNIRITRKELNQLDGLDWIDCC